MISKYNEMIYTPQYFFFTMKQIPQWARASSLSRVYDHTQTHHTR